MAEDYTVHAAVSMKIIFYLQFFFGLFRTKTLSSVRQGVEVSNKMASLEIMCFLGVAGAHFCKTGFLLILEMA